MDAREAEAARRLAEGFAEEREWDLVEVVARRVIEGEGGLEGGDPTSSSGGAAEGAAAARYLPTNAWAWKAVGVVELVRATLALNKSFVISIASHFRIVRTMDQLLPHSKSPFVQTQKINFLGYVSVKHISKPVVTSQPSKPSTDLDRSYHRPQQTTGSRPTSSATHIGKPPNSTSPPSPSSVSSKQDLMNLVSSCHWRKRISGWDWRRKRVDF